MSHVEYKVTCTLCGQAVDIEGFTLDDPEGVQKFCCAGCLSIYQLLYTSDSAPAITNTTSKKKKDITK
jgi:hypothetical protein